MINQIPKTNYILTTDPQYPFGGIFLEESGGIMEIVLNGVIYTTLIDSVTGRWDWIPPQPLPDGEYSLSFRVIDQAGNIGQPALLILQVDLNAPLQPEIDKVVDDQGSDFGWLRPGARTDDKTPTFSGSAEPNTIVRLYKGADVIGSATANENGRWVITPETELTEGKHSFTITSTDKAGHTSAVSEAFSLTIGDDITPPGGGAATITHADDNAGAITGMLKDGAITDDTTPTLHGTAPVGSSVRIQYRAENGSWLEGGNATLNGTNWTWEHSLALVEGKYEFRANAGSGWSDEFKLDIDLAPSERTEITHAIDNFGTNTGLLGNGAITDDKTPTLYGKAEANSLVYIHIRNILGMWEFLTSITADSTGNWNYNTDSLLSGTYQFQASNEQSYNEKKPLFELQIIPLGDTTSLSIDYAWDDQGLFTGEIPNLGRTDDTLPQLHGRSEANALIYIEFGIKGSELQTGFSVRADHVGNWIWQPPQEFKHAEWEFYAISGNNRSEVFSLNVTPSGEDLFGITHAIDNFGVAKGELLNGAITDDLTPTLYGYAIPGSVIKIRYGLTESSFKLSPEIFVNSNGEWTWQVPTSELSVNSKGWDFIIQSDDTEFTSIPFKLNLVSSFAPTIEGAIDDTGDSPVFIPHNDITTDTSPTIYGKAEANSIVLISYGTNATGWIDGFSATTNSSGVWEWTVPQPLVPERWTFRVKKDGGNYSPSYQIDVCPDTLYAWDFNDGKLQGWEFVGIYAQAAAMSGVKNWHSTSSKALGANTQNSKNDYSGDIAKTTITLEAGKTYEFSFIGVNFTQWRHKPSLGLSIDGITVIANTPIAGISLLYGTYVATESKDVILTLTNKTATGDGNDFAIDSITVREVDNKSLAEVSKSSINLENSDNEVITLNLADVLSQGGKSLYIDDENHQLIINGTQQDVITLNNILPADVIDGEWAQQGGTVIVAGVEYNVFTHGDNYAEVLIQNGVNTEII